MAILQLQLYSLASDHIRANNILEMLYPVVICSVPSFSTRDMIPVPISCYWWNGMTGQQEHLQVQYTVLVLSNLFKFAKTMFSSSFDIYSGLDQRMFRIFRLLLIDTFQSYNSIYIMIPSYHKNS